MTQVRFHDGPLPPMTPLAPGAGARVVFEGVVRGHEEDRPIVALDYEAYQPMADRQMAALATEIRTTHGLLEIDVHHSTGRVGVGEVSFRLAVASAHRAEALRAMNEFIDRMKQDVPIWKTPVWEA